MCYSELWKWLNCGDVWSWSVNLKAILVRLHGSITSQHHCVNSSRSKRCNGAFISLKHVSGVDRGVDESNRIKLLEGYNWQ